MLFLNWLDDILAKTGEIVGNILNYIWLSLCQLVYPLISWMFSIFSRISTLEWLSNDVISNIISRINLILIIVMTFYVTFEFVKYTVSPDTISDKEKGAMPLFARIVISVLLLAFIPTIFNYAFKIQNVIINNNIVGKVVMGTQAGHDLEGLGREFAGDVFSAFVHVTCNNNTSECQEARKKVDAAIVQVKTSTTFTKTARFMWNEHVNFQGLLALIFGVFIVYVVFIYCASVAQRHIQLLFLQIISPIAIMSYIAPKKDGMFQKWTKLCLTTYLDVFIRLLILYFMMFIIKLLSDQRTGGGIDVDVYLFLIAGLIMFLKKIPKLLEGLFPGGGAGSLGFGFANKDLKRFGARAFGTAAGIGAAAASIRGGRLFGKKGPNGNGLLSEKQRNDKGRFAKLKRFGHSALGVGAAAVKGFQSGKDGKFRDAMHGGAAKVQEFEKIAQDHGSVGGAVLHGEYYSKVLAKLKLEIEKAENKAKTLETHATTLSGVSSAKKTAEDRSGAKIQSHEQKLKLDVDAIAYLKETIGAEKMAKYGIEINDGDTTSAAYQKFEAKANSLKARTEAMNGQLVVAENNELSAIAERDAKIPNLENLKSTAQTEKKAIEVELAAAKSNGDKELISKLENELSTKQAVIDSAQKERDELELKVQMHHQTVSTLKSNIAEVEIQKGEIENLQTKALKELQRHAFSVAWKGEENADFDPGLTSNIASAKEKLQQAAAEIEIEIARLKAEGITESEAIKKLNIDKEIILYEGTSKARKTTVHNLIMNNEVVDFETYDKVEGALATYSSSLNDEVNSIKEEIRRKKEEEKWRTAEANASKKS